MSGKKSYFHTVWFSAVMVVASLLMFAEYTRLIMTGDSSTRRIVVLVLWGVIAAGWIVTLVFRWRAGRKD